MEYSPDNDSEAKEKKLLAFLWAPGWDFFSNDVAGKFFLEQVN